MRLRGFTLLELVAVAAVLFILVSTLLPTLARTRVGSENVRCLATHHALTTAWRQQAMDKSDLLITGVEGADGRALWFSGTTDFNGGNPSNWNPVQDLVKSPLWPYVGNATNFAHCPADKSMVRVGGNAVPRLRSMSMSSVFASGEWLDLSFNSAQTRWRTYRRLSAIAQPAHTFVFTDEHPDSLNDGQFANACTGNQPTDSPSASWLIDYPSNLHRGGAALSFADGHAEIHQWVGLKVKLAPLTYTGLLPLNYPAGDSWKDMHWLAANTTVVR
jgi:prepilin-type processing-associated H-X9-DG protein